MNNTLLAMQIFSWHHRGPHVLVSMLFVLLPRISSPFLLTPVRKSVASRSSLTRRCYSTTMSASSSLPSSFTISISIPDAIQMHGQDNVAFIDGSWFLNSKERNARQTFETGPRIQGAKFFDIDDIATPHHSLIHMMPSASLFAATMDAMGVSNDSTVVLYGQEQCPMVHRAWYTFMAMGHDLAKTKVLDGSVADWKAAGGPVDETPTTTLYAKDIQPSGESLSTTTTTSTDALYQATDPKQVVDLRRILQVVKDHQNTSHKDTMLIDARSSERFYAQAPEPREGLRRGHMPGAKNVFFASLLRPDNLNRLAPRDYLVERFEQAGIPLDNEAISFITTCGSGATACTVAAAMIECGVDPGRVSIYDASWMEYGASLETPISTTDE